MKVLLQEPDAHAFAPFGAFIHAPERVGERHLFGDWLGPVPGLSPLFYINRVAPSSLPLTLDRVEHHPHSAQAFLPLNVARYTVTVMPSKENGEPDPARALAILMPGTLGVVYRTGVWHASITALDAEASFAVLMWRGMPDDDVFVEIPALVVLPSRVGGVLTGGPEEQGPPLRTGGDR